jgi:hypothetical protein
MNHIYWYPHSKEAEFYKLLLDYDESLERDLADCRAIWYESWTQNLMVWYYWMSDRIATMVISKKFWFIKRLVDNDKIDLDAQAMKYAKSDLSKFFAEWKDKWWMSDDYAMLLMLLAIQDKPIEFLISILKNV